MEKPLTENELQWYADHLWDDDIGSVDGLDSDSSDLDEMDQSASFDPIDLQNATIQFEDGLVVGGPIESTGQNQETSSEEDVPGPSNNQTKIHSFKHMKETVAWKKKNLVLDDEVKCFKGDEKLPSEIMDLSTPYSFFKYFFSDDLLHKIVDESNLYALQVDPSKPANITVQDIRKFLGICIYMSVVHMPRSRSYWSTHLGFNQIKEAMSEKHFENIRKFLHFNDNSNMLPREDTDHDKLFKIRPIIDTLLSKYQSIPLEKQLSIDEQMCATKGRHNFKQYMPAKPHKWGFKLFILAGVSGFAYNFEVYVGKGSNETVNNTEVDLGPTGNLVQRLCRNVPTNKNYVVYFDNYYTSLPLVTSLAKNGIFSLGTVRRPRIPNCKLPKENEFNKMARGSSHEYVCTFDGVDVSCVGWKDNKTVCLLSTFTGTMPKTTVERFDRKLKKRVEIECPNIISEYNRHMGGVDLMDSLIGRYNIKIRSKKWYIRLFYHLLDQMLVNAWLLYRRVSQQRGEPSYMNNAQFRSDVACCLCKIGVGNHRKRGRPSDTEKIIQLKKQRSATTSYVPPKDVRLDGTSHWPLYEETRQRCKFPSCKSFSYIKCQKCGLHFCLNKNNNCFVKFHTT